MPTDNPGAPDRESPSGNARTRGKRRCAQGETEVLRKLAQPGCVFCREEEEAEERFFMWYLAESYLFSETLNRMIRSHGFCPVHTQTFIGDGIPSTIAYVYRSLTSSALRTVEEAEHHATGRRDATNLARFLLPTATCLACARRKTHVTYVQHRLTRVLPDPKSRPSLPSSPAVCLPHLRALALHLDRNGLRLLASGLRERLTGADPHAALTWTWGAPPPAAPDDQGDDARLPTTLDGLRNVLAKPGCAVCRAETHAARQYVRWLAREIRIAPGQVWRNALGLCPEHGWQFARDAAEDAVAELGAAIQRSWTERLAELAEGLTAAPAGGAVARWKFVRSRMEARTGRRREAFWAALPEALRSERQATQLHARRAFRVEPCPLCRAVATAGERMVALLSASLGDPTVRRTYQAGDGVCLRHLPAVLAQARGDEARLLLHTARVRLSVLNWELVEFLRKQSWDARYEELGPEGTAWRRAAAFVTGATQRR